MNTSGINTIPLARFTVFLWVFYSVILLISFATAQYFEIFILASLLISSLILITPFFGKSESLQDRLIICGVSFAVLITAFYPPVIGAFIALNGSSNSFFVKLLLGLRSGFYSFWIVFSFFIIAITGSFYNNGIKFLLVCTVMLFGLFFGTGPIEPKLTYFLNSFLPLFATLAIIPYVIENGEKFSSYSPHLKKAAQLIGFISVIYFPVLMLNLDLFRPDLALMHQSTDGRGLGGQLPPQWQSFVYGEFIPRFVGTFPNPILFGYFFAFSSFVFFVIRKYWISACFLILVFLSLSKGALFLLLAAHIFRQALLKSKALFLTTFISLIIAELGMAYLFDGSNRVHLRGLIGGFESIFTGPLLNLIIGFGMGSGGNLARSHLTGGPTSAGWLASGSESGLGVLVYQLGFSGVFLFILLSLGIFRSIQPNNDMRHGNAISIVALLAAWMSNMLLQEDLINVTITSQVLFAVLILAANHNTTKSKMPNTSFIQK